MQYIIENSKKVLLKFILIKNNKLNYKIIKTKIKTKIKSKKNYKIKKNV